MDTKERCRECGEPACRESSASRPLCGRCLDELLRNDDARCEAEREAIGYYSKGGEQYD